jgi:hypothetical protein
LKNSGGGNTLGKRGVDEDVDKEVVPPRGNSSVADTKLDVERDPKDPPQQSSMISSSRSSFKSDVGRRGREG